MLDLGISPQDLTKKPITEFYEDGLASEMVKIRHKAHLRKVAATIKQLNKHKNILRYKLEQKPLFADHLPSPNQYFKNIINKLKSRNEKYAQKAVSSMTALEKQFKSEDNLLKKASKNNLKGRKARRNLEYKPKTAWQENESNPKMKTSTQRSSVPEQRKLQFDSALEYPKHVKALKNKRMIDLLKCKCSKINNCPKKFHQPPSRSPSKFPISSREIIMQKSTYYISKEDQENSCLELLEHVNERVQEARDSKILNQFQSLQKILKKNLQTEQKQLAYKSQQPFTCLDSTQALKHLLDGQKRKKEELTDTEKKFLKTIRKNIEINKKKTHLQAKDLKKAK
ncbi:unnamed protein product [Moneuplotes crassus]|uniref:Uncharacterized protein n=1 Tax=Euplotes crassus TaxID=5936 RepID=A0AAD1X5A9_EUPCR|nr:unnamed protein product [Moneuplotes crassus]